MTSDEHAHLVLLCDGYARVCDWIESELDVVADQRTAVDVDQGHAAALIAVRDLLRCEWVALAHRLEHARQHR